MAAIGRGVNAKTNILNTNANANASFSIQNSSFLMIQNSSFTQFDRREGRRGYHPMIPHHAIVFVVADGAVVAASLLYSKAFI